MASLPPNAREGTIRFGTFDADIASGELRRNGSKVRLQEQPFQVLAALLETPGAVVTRENLRERVWPADTFVDFDHSLNTAINKLRDALGDSASNPRFIETLAKRGYRFIAPVQAEAVSIPVNLAQESSASVPETRHPATSRGLIRGLFVLLQVMYLIFYVLALIRFEDVQLVLAMLVPRFRSAAEIWVLLTACAGIALRFYLLSSVGFDQPSLGDKFRKVYPGLLLLDWTWALAPFLLLHEIGLGAVLGSVAALLYVPFAERALIAMAYQRLPETNV